MMSPPGIPFFVFSQPEQSYYLRVFFVPVLQINRKEIILLFTTRRNPFVFIHKEQDMMNKTFLAAALVVMGSAALFAGDI